MNDDKNKQKLGYTADIQYKEDYSTEYSKQPTTSVGSQTNGVDYDDDFMSLIQDDVDALIDMIPGLPWDMQTAINQVFKPVIKDWNKIKDRKYPKTIPDDTDPIIDPGDEYDPIPPGKIKRDPWTITDPVPPNNNPIFRPEENERPGYIVPDVGDTVNPDIREDPTRENPDVSVPFITDDDLFTPATKRKVTYIEIDKKEQYELEYTKNMADLIHFYTTKLKGIISNYYMQMFYCLFSLSSDEDASFISNQITSLTCETKDEFRHLMDAALRNEVISGNKLNFCINTFSLEGSLYHLKNLRAAQELRLRYAEIDRITDSDHGDSMSNKILSGMTDMYSAKYDSAYINLYKHLNGSLQILDDCFKTIMSGLKAKEILIRKDGRKK